MKKLQQYRKILEFLANAEEPVTYADVMFHLGINRKQFDPLMKDLRKYVTPLDQMKGLEHKWDKHRLLINHSGVEYLRDLKLQDIAEDQRKTNKVLATATVAIALASAVDAVTAMKDFDTSNVLDIVGLVGIGILVLILVTLALKSWEYLRS